MQTFSKISCYALLLPTVNGFTGRIDFVQSDLLSWQSRPCLTEIYSLRVYVDLKKTIYAALTHAVRPLCLKRSTLACFVFGGCVSDTLQ